MVRAVRGSHHDRGEHFRGDRSNLRTARNGSWSASFVYCSALSKHRDSMLTVGRPCLFSEGVKLLVRPEVVNDALFLSFTSAKRESPG
jgi:hypothetical protein